MVLSFASGSRWLRVIAGSMLSLSLLLAGCEDMELGSAEADSSPSFGDQTPDDLRFPAGIPVKGLKLPAATGGNGTLTYRWTLDVAGLKLDPVKHTVSGTPILDPGVTRHTYRMGYVVTDADGDSDSLRIEVDIFRPDRLVIGSPISDSLSSTDSSDYYQVTVRQRGTLVVATDIARDSRADNIVRLHGAPGYPSKNRDFDDHIDAVFVDPGTYYISVVVAPGGATGGYDLAAWLIASGDSSFDIDVRYVGSTPTDTKPFDDAVAFWESAITGDLQDLPVLSSDWTCEEGDPSRFGESVDDVTIYVKLEAIDGTGGTLAQAGPCLRRSAAFGGLPTLGVLVLDTADLAAMTAVDLGGTIIHEMAHVLGFGLLWEHFGFLEAPSLDQVGNEVAGQDTHFDGPLAIAEFNSSGIGGSSYTDAKVPVENDTDKYDIGGLDGHWRESVFATESMTPTIDSGVLNPVSTVTIASLEDLGYVVDYTAADTFMLSRSGRSSRHGGTRRSVNLGDDIRRGPVQVVEIPDEVTQLLGR